METFFVGKYERQLDPKGRLALPATFRPQLEPRCVLKKGLNGRCVSISTVEQAKTDADKIIAEVEAGLRDFDELRAMGASMVEVVIDAQGRVTIEEELRKYANLAPGSKVVVTGLFRSIEIWDPAVYEAIDASGSNKIAGVA